MHSLFVAHSMGNSQLELTGSWAIPFYGSIALLLLGAGRSFFMHPDRSFIAAGPSVTPP
jgi:hypothetical protein